MQDKLAINLDNQYLEKKSCLKDVKDYDINVRFQNKDRYNKSALFNQNITFRDMASGKIKSVPVVFVTDKNAGFSAIKHRT